MNLLNANAIAQAMTAMCSILIYTKLIYPSLSKDQAPACSLYTSQDISMVFSYTQLIPPTGVMT